VISDLSTNGTWLLVIPVLAAAVPLVVATYQFALVALHSRFDHYGQCAPFFPCTAVVVPAWNEGAVVGTTVDRLMQLDYPKDSLRIFVVDDASTDETPDVVLAKADQYPGNVVHLRRDKGGEGKAHTLNHGLRVILQDDWAEAVLIMDADVIFERDALRKMTRHLADDRVGSVTAYVKEGSRPGNYVNRFISYEYVTAQAGARRAQNVMGALACLAGGAQLHSRANLESLGGAIDTSSLAEDTFTTFKTQLAGHKVIFEPHAIVWAEEPGALSALWKQRVRWARGNVRVTTEFSHVWFRRSKVHKLGGIAFGLVWFSIFLLPLLMLAASASLVALFFLDFSAAWHLFRILWIINVISYVFITTFSLLIDTDVAKRCWREAFLYPGVVSLLIILYTCFPKGCSWLIRHGAIDLGQRVTVEEVHGVILFAFIWLSACMLVSYFAKIMEGRRGGRWVSPICIYVGGYGPLLCAVALAAYVKELRKAEMTWDKTEKTGKVDLTL
jgi:cellulose synthase/poly-beta-1,6-N-acetylglucosamine synthase-like glycosyltransferase